MQSTSPDRVHFSVTSPHYPREDAGQDMRQEPPREHHRDIVRSSTPSTHSRDSSVQVIPQPGVPRDHREDSSSEATDQSGSSQDEDRGEAIGHMEEPSGVVPAANFSCRFCPDGLDADEPVFRCPCRCPDVFIHRSCLEDWLYRSPEASCPTCGAGYPVRRKTKALWRWFWEEESRKDAAVFFANAVFSFGNVGVLCMAWLYVLFEYKSSSWISSVSLALALLIVSLLWVAFGCIRFHVLFKTYATWRRLNTTLKVRLEDKTVGVPA
ncbi:unnamed protein product [Ixodes hexagonus]